MTIKKGNLQIGLKYLGEAELAALKQLYKVTKGKGGWYSKNALMPQVELDKQKRELTGK